VASWRFHLTLSRLCDEVAPSPACMLRDGLHACPLGTVPTAQT
jgi:hypothetical protein